MATPNLMNDITAHYSHLTKAEKKVATMVLSNPQAVLNATIIELAEMCGVGDTSVFRFCRSLRLNGYQDFKVSLALSTNPGNMPGARPGNGGAGDDDSPEALINGIYEEYDKALRDTVRSLNPLDVSKAASILIGAEAVHFFGFGGSGITAMEAHSKFLRVSSKFHFAIDAHMQLMTASLLDEGAAAVIFSNSGITKDSIEIARLAHQLKAKTVFITKFAKTPAKEHSDVVLISGAIEGPMQGGSIAVKTSQLFLIDVLYSEFFRRTEQASMENKKATARIIADKML